MRNTMTSLWQCRGRHSVFHRKYGKMWEICIERSLHKMINIKQGLVKAWSEYKNNRSQWI